MDGQNVQNKRQLVKRRSESYKKALKVVYISSPMKVKTCASKFRALVQELTGKDSDIVSLMDVNGGEYSPTVSEESTPKENTSLELLPKSEFSKSMFGETFYNDHSFIMPQMDESLFGMFLENVQFDELRCFNGP